MGKIILKSIKSIKKIFCFIIVNKIKCYFGVISKTEKNQCKLKTAPLPQKSTCMTFFLIIKVDPYYLLIKYKR